MRPHSSPTRLLALAAITCCSGIVQADDAFDLIGETMASAFQLSSMNPDDGLYILADGRMQSGDVITGVRHGTGEQAMLVIDESISTVERIGLSDDDPVIGIEGFREHVRQLHGTLIGTEGVVDVTVLAIPNPISPDGWALLPTSPDASFFEGIEHIDFSDALMADLESTLGIQESDDGLATGPPTPTTEPVPTPYERFCLDENGDPIYPASRYKPFCICSRFYDCHLALQAYPGPEPSCNEAEQNGGIPECMRAAFCRWKKCVWAAATNDALCRCEAIKKSCKSYRRRFGEDPGHMWRGRANTSGCWGMAESLACSALLAAEEAGCIWPF